MRKEECARPRPPATAMTPTATMMTAIMWVPLQCGGGGKPMMEGEILTRELETRFRSSYAFRERRQKATS